MNESEKMLDIIHQNCKQKRILKEEREKSKERKEKRARRIEITILVVALIGLFTIYGIYKDRQVKNCMNQGGSENFCRYAGE